ncbi:MAG: 50S ribosomal protein L25/general stress protein Ctc [Rhodocyclaceae bacterium]|nr:50S ribosomal protein L25/general stress protein Ctc [Rhodocyclaceae bacterium]
MTIEFIALNRTTQGTGASRRLRRTGKVPGIVYGGHKDAVAIELDHNALYYALQEEAFHASVLSMSLDGKKEPVLLRDYQMHPFKQQVLHIDFQRIAAGEKIHMKVPLHFTGEDLAPGVKLQGGKMSHVVLELDIACLPENLPEFITVDLSGLNAGQSVHLADLNLPEGVESTALRHGDNAVVAVCMAPRGGADESAAESQAQ